MRTFLILAAVFGLSLAQIEFEELNKLTKIESTQLLTNTTFDCVIYINDLTTASSKQPADLNPITNAIGEYISVGQKISSGVVVPFLAHPSKKMIVGITGDLKKDYADARLIYDAAKKAAKTMKTLNLRKPLLVVGDFSTRLPEENQPWAYKIWPQLTSILGMFHELYVPLQVRESRPKTYPRFDEFGILNAGENVITFAQGIEAGRYVNRDLCASDQERTTPIKIAKYIEEHFKQPTVVKQKAIPITKDAYPTMHAVNRVNQGMGACAGSIE